MKFINLKKYQQGFTFLEVLISVAIISFILAAVFRLQNYFFDQQQNTLNYFISVDFTNRSVEKMVKEIRNSRVANNGAYTLAILNNQELAFYTNIDNDPEVERVRYFLQNNSLYRGIINPTGQPIQYLIPNEKISLIAEKVTNGTIPIFQYFNSNWPDDTVNNPLPLQNRATQTRLIGITLILKTEDNAQNNDYQIKTYAQIRTLKDNL